MGIPSKYCQPGLSNRHKRNTRTPWLHMSQWHSKFRRVWNKSVIVLFTQMAQVYVSRQFPLVNIHYTQPQVQYQWRAFFGLDENNNERNVEM